MFSLFLPRLREGRAAPPKPMTGGRQVLLVALIVIIGGYPIGRWAADRIFLFFAESATQSIMTDPLLTDAIKLQNSSLERQTQAELDAIDKAWIEERKNPGGPLTGSMLQSAPSRRLIELLAASHGAVTHGILMDGKGRNVAIGAPTTDYWQGDEAKFLKTAAAASHQISRGEIELRHDGQGSACWISQTIFEAGKPIGALAVELNLDHISQDQCAPSR